MEDKLSDNHAIEYLNDLNEWYADEIEENLHTLETERNHTLVERSMKKELEFYQEMIKFNNDLLGELEIGLAEDILEKDAPLLQMLADMDEKEKE